MDTEILARLDAEARDLVRLPEVCRRYQLKKRTVEAWVAAADQNGLAPAVVRKGRLVHVRLSKFLAWWLYGNVNATAPEARAS